MQQQHPNVRAVFDRALEIESPAERQSYVEQVCAGDPSLRHEVEALLRAHECAGDFLQAPAALPSLGEKDRTDVAGSPHPDETRASDTDGHAGDVPLDFLGPPHRAGGVGRLGHYEVERVVGQGGMGIVLKAFDEQLHRVVAIKALAPQLAASATARQRFLREARAAAAVTHEHVVTIHAVDEGQGVPYLVMQYVAGLSLQEKLDGAGQLGLKEVLRIGMQAASGLAAAHKQGLVHRDIKPANILLENGVERVKITDFGLARAANDANLTQSGVIAGTPMYMSPEQAEGRPVDHRSDLFSLGSVLYAMCTGRPPFRASSAVAVLKRVCEHTPPPIRDLNPDMPEWLCAIIDKLHAKDPAARYQSATEVAELLGQHLAKLQDPSQPRSAAAPPVPLPTAPAHRPRRRLAVAALALLLLVAGGLGLTEATGLTNVRSTVIRLFTPEGTLIVETDDPQVMVVIDGEDLVIRGAGPQEVRLRPGCYQLRAVKNGLAIREELVTITHGGRQVVRISHEPRGVTRNGEPGPQPEIAGDWVRLFNGKDLTGWRERNCEPGTWKVENGVLIGRDAFYGELITQRGDFDDYQLRVEARINAGGDSGVFNRISPGGGVSGFEVQIGGGAPHPPTGSVLFKGGAEPAAVAGLMRPGEWFNLDIVVRGNRIQTKVNGTVAVDLVELKALDRRGHINLQLLKDTVVEFRKIEIKELQRDADRPFTLLAGGKAGSTFPTLAQAVASAGAGDTIEIRGDGPFVTEPVNLGQRALTLRAGLGFRPVLKLDPKYAETDAPLLLTKAALVLEGIEFQRVSGKRWEDCTPVTNVVTSEKAPLYVANCRFLVKPGWNAVAASQSPALKVRNCEFLSFKGNALECSLASAGRLAVENCTLTGSTGLGLHYAQGPQDVSVRLTHNTWRNFRAVLFMLDNEPKYPRPGQASHPYRIESSGNLFDTLHAAWAFEQTKELLARQKLLAEPEAEAVLKRLFDLQDRQNLYGSNIKLLELSANWDPLTSQPDAKDMAGWERFWRHFKTGSMFGRVRYAGGDVRAMAAKAPEQLTPQAFRLRPDSDGYRAGPGGKDLGADVDLVGPGAAYGRFRQSPAYGSWLKDSGQKAPELAAAPFAVLARGAGPERTFATLADAVAKAADGDTVEVRGDGPFVTEPINLGQRALTLRAGLSFRPVLKLDPKYAETDAPLLLTKAALVLEGIEFQRVSGKRWEDCTPVTNIVTSEKAPLYVANCRFLLKPGWNAVTVSRSPALKVRNCEFLSFKGNALECSLASAGRLVVENCTLTGGTGLGLRYLQGPQDVSVRLTNNTWRGFWSVLFMLDNEPQYPRPGQASYPYRVGASGNLFDASDAVWEFEQTQELLARQKSLTPPEAAAVLKRLFDLRDQHNLYGSGVKLLQLSANWVPLASQPDTKDMVGWERFWRHLQTGSTLGQVRYAGGDIRAMAAKAPEQLTPQAFRLRPDSDGYRAGPGGKDLGADVDLVGPGAAYQRFRQSPAYGSWLKDSGQKAPELAAAPFAVLARGAGPERTFGTLADAVAKAADGDTVEVRGDGPFVTEPITIKDRALVIRAAAGCRPVLAMSAEGLEGKEPLLNTNASLVLEGLELRRLGSRPIAQDPSILSVLVTSGPELRLAHCRLLINRREVPQYAIHCINTYGAPVCELRGCEILAGSGAALTLGDGRATLEHCVVACDYGLLLYSPVGEARKIAVTLRHNTLLTRHAIQWNLHGDGKHADKATKLCEVHAADNIFTGNVCFNQEGRSLGGGKDYLTAQEAQALLPRFVDWREDRNLYPADTDLLQLSGDFKKLPGERGIRTLAEWQRLWSVKQSSSLFGKARFHGGEVAHKAYTTPLQVVPEDFGLADGSPGQGAGPGGTDLGANVDRVGPGAAYEQFRQSPGYREWLKLTGQTKGAGPSNVVAALVAGGLVAILGSTSLLVYPRRCDFPAHWDPKLRIPRGQVVAAASIVSPKY